MRPRTLRRRKKVRAPLGRTYRPRPETASSQSSYFLARGSASRMRRAKEGLDRSFTVGVSLSRAARPAVTTGSGRGGGHRPEGHQRCVGCEGRSSRWSPTGVRAVHTALGPGGRRRKGLEPSRRLSETTGPRSPSAFRVVFPATEVTKCGARRSRRRRRERCNGGEPMRCSRPAQPARVSTNTRRAVRGYRRGVARAAAPGRDGKDERAAPTDRHGP